jgi:hypothetical protein
MSAAFDFLSATAPEWAAMYRSLGLQVVPAHLPGDGKQWKRPYGEWVEFQKSLASDAVFRRWFDPATGEHRNRQNMGLILGQASGGMFAIDLDVLKPGGEQAYDWWERLKAEHTDGKPMPTWKQITGGGGRQILFRSPDGWEPPTFTTSLCVDLRGQGGFIMAPPSLHASGNLYHWLIGFAPWEIDPMWAPNWLCDEIDALRPHAALPGHRAGHLASCQLSTTSAFGRLIDGRERFMAKLVWAVMVDLKRRYGDALPPPEVFEAECARAYAFYASRVEPKEGGSP